MQMSHLLLAVALLLPASLMAQDDAGEGDETGGRLTLDSDLPETWYVGVSPLCPTTP